METGLAHRVSVLLQGRAGEGELGEGALPDCLPSSELPAVSFGVLEKPAEITIMDLS